ncbi:MAG: hypothetical protein IRZ09_05270 [Variibacter sp.]|nr:hypothetical protein [Variibacter sp.]
MAPAGTPAAVVETVHRAVVGALNDPQIRKQADDLGLEIVGNAPEAFRAMLEDDLPRWAEIIKASGTKGD